MKKNILFALTFAFLFIGQPLKLKAQNTSAEKKMNTLISAIDETKFIIDYKEFKNQIEGLAAEIKLSEADAKEIAKAKLSYNQSRLRFDAILDQLKRDLANPDTRKLITKSPEAFSRNYQKRLDECKLFCNDNFKKKASAILKTDALDAESIQLIIGSFFSIFKVFSEKKTAENEFSIQYLEVNLIEPLRFKTWDKIE
jgi:hypothetical protein